MDLDCNKTKAGKKFTINDFPLEILAYIFSFLELKECIRIEIVCKRWREVTVTIPWQFNSLKSDQLPYFLTENMLVAILKRCGRSLQHLNMLEFPNLDKLTSQLLSSISQYCPNLIAIAFAGENRTSNSKLKVFFTKCTLIKNVTVINNVFTDDQLMKVFPRCKSLESLSIQQNDTEGQCFSLLSKTLKTLSLKNCINLTLKGIQKLQFCTGLEELTLHGNSNLDHSALNFICNNFSSTLKKLHLLHQNNIDFNKVLLEKLPKLEELSFIWMYNVTPNFLKEILKKCPMVWKVDIHLTQVTKPTLQLFATHPKIIDLNISCMKEDANDELVHLAHLGKLEALNVSRCDWLTNETCIALIEHCKNLNYLDVSYCCLIYTHLFEDVQMQERSVKLTIVVNKRQFTSSIEFQNILVKVKSCPYDFLSYSEDEDSDDDYRHMDDYDFDYDHQWNVDGLDFDGYYDDGCYYDSEDSFILFGQSSKRYYW